MASSLSVLLLCTVVYYVQGGINHPHHSKQFHYRGWGWTHNLPMLPDIPSGIAYADPLMVTSQCIVTMKNATFNLLPLHLNPAHANQFSYYSVHDARSSSSDSSEFKYAFNVCGAVLEIPDGCVDAPGSYCEDNNLDANGTCNVAMRHVNGSVYAYQMQVDADGAVEKCWHLSDTLGGPGVWSLINEDNPSEGVTVSYLDGDYEVLCGHNRQMNISFICDNDHGAFGIPSEAHSEVDYTIGDVSEEEICQYKLEFHTVYGCPSQCPIVGNKLCNGVGLCGYDWTIKQPRCYCYSLFTGDSCTQIDMFKLFKPKHDPITANLSSPMVKQFEHKLVGPSKQNHKVTVTYDLDLFRVPPNKPYIMHDVDGITHTYVMNFGDVIDYDAVVSDEDMKTLRDYGCHLHTGYCSDLDGDCTKSSNLIADGGFVFQIDVENDECVVAGGKSENWVLYDEDNPARGVEITFSNGDYCVGKKKNREFKVILLCPDDSNTYLPLSDETQRVFDAFVEEDDFDFCSYHVTITSAFACPDECLTDATNTPDIPNDVSVCSTQGMCASDPFSGYVHCLCDDGWDGDYCQTPYVAPPPPYRYKNKGTYIAAIVIISAILISVCYFGYKKIVVQKQKVKELEIKLVNYQSSGGQVFHNERPPQLDQIPQSKGQSLSDKIKNKFSKNKRGYANISGQNDEDDEQELFNVKVKMDDAQSSDDEEENDDDAGYNKQQHIIGDDDEDEDDDDDDDSDKDGDDDDEDEDN